MSRPRQSMLPTYTPAGSFDSGRGHPRRPTMARNMSRLTPLTESTFAADPGTLVASVEKIPTTVYRASTEASRAVAGEIADLIREKASRGETAVLGLATGSTPTGVYDELIRLHREEGLSFANVVTFNLDEYHPMRPEELQS